MQYRECSVPYDLYNVSVGVKTRGVLSFDSSFEDFTPGESLKDFTPGESLKAIYTR